MKSKIRTTTCVLLFLFTSLGECSGGFGNPVTDDVSRLMLLKHNIPKDYNISMHYIPKEMRGVCWVLLNIYPLEQSLRELARVFGAISSNKDNIMIFITMLQNLRFTFDHEELEATMQVFKCHYRAVKWPSGQYFDYIRDILNSAAQGEGGFHCVPPPCPAPTTPGSEAQDHEQTRSRGSLLSLLLIPVTACVLLIVWAIKSRRGGSTESSLERGHRRLSPDVERTITTPIPPLSSPPDTPIMGAARSPLRRQMSQPSSTA